MSARSIVVGVALLAGCGRVGFAHDRDALGESDGSRRERIDDDPDASSFEGGMDDDAGDASTFDADDAATIDAEEMALDAGGDDATSGEDAERGEDGAAAEDATSDAGADGALDGASGDADMSDAPDANRLVTRVFASSELFTGNLGGLEGADAHCQRLADDAELGGTWLTWSSDLLRSPFTRFDHSSMPYVLLDGTVVADDWTDLVDGTLDHAIDMTETRDVPPMGTAACTPGAIAVLSGTTLAGTTSLLGNCAGWTSSGALDMQLGNALEADEGFTSDCVMSGAVSAVCDRTGVIYCFEQ